MLEFGLVTVVRVKKMRSGALRGMQLVERTPRCSRSTAKRLMETTRGKDALTGSKWQLVDAYIE